MKKILLPVLLSALIFQFSAAQSDTVYHYFSTDSKEVSSADSAFSYMKVYKKDNLWYGKGFYKKTNIEKSEGNYTDKDAKKPIGSFKNFNEKGVLDNTAEWDNGKPATINYYYKNGNKKLSLSFNDKGVDRQKAWDENGDEIRNYVFEREARFKGGLDGWRKFLEKHVNANAATDAGAPAGKYEVKLQFVVSKEGYVTKVKAISIPAACKACAAEAINVISNCPPWEPAIQFNEPVIYQAEQYITFVVEETKKGKKS